jgi:hypothetical protein
VNMILEFLKVPLRSGCLPSMGHLVCFIIFEDWARDSVNNLCLERYLVVVRSAHQSVGLHELGARSFS